jgi:hypothetical protein
MCGGLVAVRAHKNHANLSVCVPQVRCQRLDQWLVSNARLGLRVPVAFFDYETNILGKPKVELSPLRDLQRFLRHGFAARPRCLLGVTLSFRQYRPAEQGYPPEAPNLTEADLAGFVAAEAAAVGMTSTVLETARYGMIFTLFLLEALETETKDSAAGSRAAASSE